MCCWCVSMTNDMRIFVHSLVFFILLLQYLRCLCQTAVVPKWGYIQGVLRVFASVCSVECAACGTPVNGIRSLLLLRRGLLIVRN